MTTELLQHAVVIPVGSTGLVARMHQLRYQIHDIAKVLENEGMTQIACVLRMQVTPSLWKAAQDVRSATDTVSHRTDDET